MQNCNYLRCELTQNNTFIGELSINYNNSPECCIYGVVCKIDTGANISCIPAKYLKIDTELLKDFKQQAIDKNIHSVLAFGVNDTEELKNNSRQLKKDGKLVECEVLKFLFDMDDIEINGYNLGTRKIGINFDRTGNILIGMDILKELDIHIGTDKNTNECVLLACKKDEITPEYRCALKSIFGILRE